MSIKSGRWIATIGRQPWCLHINFKTCFVDNSSSSHTLSHFFHKINCKIPSVPLKFLPASVPLYSPILALSEMLPGSVCLIPALLYSPAQVTPSDSLSADQPLHVWNSCPNKHSYLLFGPCYIYFFLRFWYISFRKEYCMLTYKITSIQRVSSYIYFVLMYSKTVLHFMVSWKE